MIPKEVLKRVRLIEIRTRHLVNALFSGEYHSVFKGRGVEFAEVRAYQPGDDIRIIDWNVTARTGHPFVKLFDEERELTVMLVVDLSRSGVFGTVHQSKREMAAELSALLAFSAIKNNDRVGLIGFTDRIEQFLPPKKGKKHVLRVIRELLYFRPEGVGTDIEAALQHLSRVTTRRCVVFLVSDFFSEGYETALRVLNKRHDIVAISITDPRETALPKVGLLHLEDAETGDRQVVDTSDPDVRRRFGEMATRRREVLDRLFRSAGVDSVVLSTDASYVEPLSRFFKMRARRFR
ncbi:MAG: DUF58 domain-containing protein [Candidatus Latescibacterota bacterium]